MTTVVETEILQMQKKNQKEVVYLDRFIEDLRDRRSSAQKAEDAIVLDAYINYLLASQQGYLLTDYIRLNDHDNEKKCEAKGHEYNQKYENLFFCYIAPFKETRALFDALQDEFREKIARYNE